MSEHDMPAFPADIKGRLELGMTLRDYFAAMAMQAFLMKDVDAGGDDHLAECSYRIADAMLAERSK